ncbi:Uma2 family endonuclease [Candidatus Parabeggiatoa sp. HSG14]|uniref:Uma2 family endonuclease n=1 Tax=Candidatus Parabeggiatoa sp. HSG14 TaxID=3055593 RepID=UPI0025A71903|nr:Uma2 family endonuclease [Thiotrichales bacterium HSG14]
MMSLQTLKQNSFPVENVVGLSGISWERFNKIQSDFDGVPSVKLTYTKGLLEIMAPISDEHEYVKSNVGELLGTYMREKHIRFYKRGGFTLKKEGYSSGEPDESYCIGTNKEIPDIVIEVIITSGTLNKLEVYKPLNIPEVWFWKKKQLQIFHLTDGEYQQVTRSHFFSDLDLETLQHYIDYSDQYDAVIEFQKTIREMNKNGK